MNSPALYGAITMVTWGIWLVLGNQASESIDTEVAAAISYVVAAVFAVLYAVVSDASLSVSLEGGVVAIVAGVFTAIGLISTYVGLSLGSTTVVSTIGAMYFVVAAVIGVGVLGEELTLSKVAGAGFAVVAVVLIAR